MNALVEIVESEYEDSKVEVMRTVAAKLASAGVELPALDLEAFYNAAWQVLFLKLGSGEEVENRKGFLVTVTHRLALSEHRGVHREHSLDSTDLDRIAIEHDYEAPLQAAKRISELKEALRLGLSERELQAAMLCYFQGYSRADAAQVIGVPRRRMEKIMDRVSRKVGTIVGTIRADGWCDEVDSLIRAYAAGILPTESERYRVARQHLDRCSACRRKVLLLRGLLGAGPPIPLAALLAGGAGGVGNASGGDGGTGTGGSGGSSTGLIVGGVTAGLAVVAAIVAAVLAFGGEGDDRPQTQAARPTGSSASEGANETRPADQGERSTRRKPKRVTNRDRPVRAAEQSAVSVTPAPPPADSPPAEQPVPAPAPEPASPPEPAREDREAQLERPLPPLRDAAVEFELR